MISTTISTTIELPELVFCQVRAIVESTPGLSWDDAIASALRQIYLPAGGCDA